MSELKPSFELRASGDARCDIEPLHAGALRVVIADDQELVRSGFAAILNASDDIEVVGEAENGLEALARVRELEPDVVVMDIRMPVLDGLAATEKLRELAPDVRVLILTTFDLDEYVYRALKIGAAGFLLKDAEPGALADALRTIAADEALLDPAVTKRLIERFNEGQISEVEPGVGVSGEMSEYLKLLLDSLTPREHEILLLVARGLSNEEIASELYISVATAKTHVNRVMAKCNVHDRAALVVLAYESGLVRAGS
ncbi:MAG: response regulator transcription factor [Coriobacteriia bacterium]|nr:response regulator transcription factor [Coriobacteriia bacterium]MCL2537554.1 response regulator transcription factor [Coriobacteriia bacterium]